MTTTSNGAEPRWWLMLLAAFAALSLLLAACGDSGNGGSESSESTAGGEGEGDGGKATEDAPEFGKFSSGWENVEARITYEVTSGTGADATTSTMTYYNQPPNNRTDFEADGEITSFIQQEGIAYLCAENQCISYEGEGTLNPIPFFSNFAAPAALEAYAGVAVLDTDSDETEIAGLSATCYSIDQDGVETGWCFGEDGLLLRTFSEADGSEFEMRAIEVSDDVSSSDFDPPYDVVELPDIGDITQ